MPMDWWAILVAVTLSQALAGPADSRWPAVLEGFDAIRSQAFEESRSELLESVYTEDSVLLRRDKALLDSYVQRGVEIDRMRLKLIEARVVTATSRRAVLSVVDQLAEARIRLSDGTVRELPRDQPTRRIIELSLTPQGWRISAVSLRP